MKKILIVFLALWGPSFLLLGQSFPSGNASWQGTAGTIAGPLPFRQALCGDTTINGRLYARYNDISFDAQGNAVEHYFMGIRTDGPRSWFISAGEDQEYLLYDFSLEEGEEATLRIVFFLLDSVTLRVESIDTVTVGGQARKRINFEPRGSFRESWIEGVGSLYGNVSRGLAAFDAVSELWCFRQNGNLEFSTVDASECDFEYTCTINDAEETKAGGALFSLYPTVSGGQLQFNNPYPFETILRAYQLNGKLMGEYGPFGPGQHHFSCPGLSAGLYVFQVAEKNNNLSLQHFKLIIGE